METFSPIDSVELLSSPSQIDTSKAGSKWWIWGILIAVMPANATGLIYFYYPIISC